MKDLLAEGFSRLGLGFSDEQLADCHAFLRELQRWSSSVNLVGSAEPGALVDHLIDSLAALSHLDPLSVVDAADAGSGGGFPGIPLAIFLPSARMTLVERSAKKVAFLRNAAAMLSCRDRIRVVQADLRGVTKTFDLVVTRALTTIDTGFKLLWPITATGGRLVFYKGRRETLDEELRRTETVLSPKIIPLYPPGVEGERHLVVFINNSLF